MSAEAASIIGAIIAAQSTAIILLAYVLVKTREQLARLEQHIRDLTRRSARRHDAETS